MKFLRWIHKWTGLIVGLFFLILCLTGLFIVAGKLLGSYSPFFRWMRTFHTSLFCGETGSLVIGTATLLSVIEIITGYCLWGQQARALTKSYKKKGAGAWKGFRRSMSWTKPTYTRGFHIAGGVWTGIPLLLMALTALTWSFGWYADIVYALFDNPATNSWDSNLFHTLHSLHVGSWCGTVSRLVWLCAVAIGVALPVTGAMISFRKR